MWSEDLSLVFEPVNIHSTIFPQMIDYSMRKMVFGETYSLRIYKYSPIPELYDLDSKSYSYPNRYTCKYYQLFFRFA